MTMFEYAIYRYAARLMRPDERQRAEALARAADAGDRAALLSLQELAMDVIARSPGPSGKRKKEQS